jgi:glycerol-3-phosphate dehydrogenase
MIEKVPTLVNIGYASKTVTPEEKELIKNIFQTEYFRVRLTNSLAGIELAGALKNVYAIASGISQGLGYGLNTRAKLITLAVEEILMFCEKLHYVIDPRAMPGIIGDIVLTCGSTESRNFTFGEMLATHSVEDSLRHSNGVVEGYHTAEGFRHLTEQVHGDTPLAQLVFDILLGEKQTDIREGFLRFFRHE